MPQYFEFEVSLCRLTPRIWRRFLLAVEGSTFMDLHEAIQVACGWQSCHEFLFQGPAGKPDPVAGTPSQFDMEMFGRKVPRARTVPLTTFFKKEGSDTCRYEYDFGDSWIHEVRLVREVDLPETFWRRLLAGERAFPHEDSGGISGYERFSKIVTTGLDPCGDDPKALLAWLEGWHPERFDLEATKAKFDRAAPKQRKGPRLTGYGEDGGDVRWGRKK